MKVLDLFAGTQSVRKALETMNIDFDYKGIDIMGEGNIIIDLSSPFALEMVLDRLGDWVPDFIWASPVCNTFSTACAYKGGNLYYEKINDMPVVRTKMDDPNNRRYSNILKLPEYQAKAKLGLDMHNNGKAIIDHYKKPFAIENPAGAMSRLLYKDYVRNVCSYCMYGFSYKKHTAIYSNKELNLLKCNHKEKHQDAMSGVSARNTITDYSQRASVPPQLIKQIIEEVK